MKRILILVILISAGCNQAQLDEVNIGESFTNKRISNPNTDTYTNSIHSKQLPIEATDITYIGRNWVTFKFKGTCFLLAAEYRSSVMSNYPCN